MQSNKSYAAAGRLLAVMMLMFAVALTQASPAWATEYKVLYKFKFGGGGRRPYAGLILDAAGNLYGTTSVGGTGGLGTAFKLTPNPDGSWTETAIHSFSETGDGYYPDAGLVFDGSGNLYGTTSSGGVNGWGTAFRLAPNPDGSWTETILHSFSGVDGSTPSANLVFDANGDLYGTSFYGGDLSCNAPYGCGTVFKLTPNRDGSWTETVLHSFEGGTEGYEPYYAGVIFDAAGTLYGTTSVGGPNDCGTVFKLTPNPDGSWTHVVIASFGGHPGRVPAAGLVFDASGNLYGTTLGGNPPWNYGTVFKLAPNPDGSWKKSTLHVFQGKDGSDPWAGLIFDAAGDLYGTTSRGGAYDRGTVFKLAPQPDGHWAFSRLHTFNDHYPYAGLVMDSAGKLYGTTESGGIWDSGIVFRITP